MNGSTAADAYTSVHAPKPVAAARRRRGLGEASRQPSEALRQLARLMAHEGFLRCGGTAQMVAVALVVRHCDQNGMCFPAVETIAAEIGVSPRRVPDHLTTLEENLVISFPDGRSGGRVSSLIRLDAALPNPVENDVVANPVETDTVSVDNPVGNVIPGVSKTSSQPRRNRHPNRSKKNRSKKNTAAAATHDGSDLEAFTSLVEGIELREPGRTVVLNAYLAEPKRVKDCIAHTKAEARAGRVHSPGGFLRRLVESGDHPSPGGGRNASQAALSWARNVGCHLNDTEREEEIAKWQQRGVDELTLARVRDLSTAPQADAA